MNTFLRPWSQRLCSLTIWGSFLFVIGAMILPAAATAQNLAGVWRSDRAGVPPRTFTPITGGGYTVTSRGMPIANAYILGGDVSYTTKEGLPFRGTVTEYFNGQPAAIRFNDGTTYRRWGTPGAADPLPAPAGAANPQLRPPVPTPSPSPTPAPFPVPPVAPPTSAPSLAGSWDSSVGLTYRITQVGDRFQWTVDGLSQVGQGTIVGERVSASWQGPLVRGSSNGTIVSDVFGPAQIRFTNGVVLTRR